MQLSIIRVRIGIQRAVLQHVCNSQSCWRPPLGPPLRCNFREIAAGKGATAYCLRWSYIFCRVLMSP